MALVKCILNNHEVEYDDSEFEFIKAYDSNRLHYIGDGKNVTNPKGNTSCYRMFETFKGTELDLTNFDTNNITNTSFMFNKCYNLKHLNLSNFNTNNVRDMSYMFNELKSLEHLNLSSFDTSNVITTECMFCNCINLKTLDISKIDTENVIYMEDMFQNCKSLKELDISSFYIDNTKMLDNMFWNCKSLETLKVGSDCLQFFSINRGLLNIENRVNIISMSKLDKAVNDLFY